MAQTKQKQSDILVGSFYHSSNEYTLKEFIDVFKRKLPKVFAVTQGFYGIDDMHSIGSEEIYRIEKIVKQPRIVLRQKDGTELSIPEEYKFSKFQYLLSDGKASKPMTLKQMIKEKKSKLSSLKIQLENDLEADFMIGNEEKSSTSLGFLEFVDTYQEKYLIGFSIIQGKIAPIAMALPVYVDINVSDVTRMTKGSQIKLADYLGNLPQHLIEACNRVELNEDISMLPKVDKKPESDYQYIIPDHYMTLIKREKDGKPSRASVLNTLKPASQEVPPTLPKRHYNRYSVTETRPPRHLPVKSVLSLPLPSPPVSGDKDSHSYEKLKTPTNNPDNPYGSRPIYKSLSEVPVDLSGLSKYRIADCLRLLNLQHHGDRFIKESVDGNLVAALDESMLMEEFKFTKFEAVKVMRFIKGWRPIEESFF